MIYEFSQLYPLETLKILSKICQRAVCEYTITEFLLEQT